MFESISTGGVMGGMALLLVAAQLVPVDRSNPPVIFEVTAPMDVMEILDRSCYDCHSNETDWPWYSRVAPASWLVARDVRLGREDLNFSSWPILDAEAEAYQRRLIADDVEAGRMPPGPYVMLHPEAELTEADREALLEWARAPARELAPTSESAW